jgi:hypothetical protein
MDGSSSVQERLVSVMTSLSEIKKHEEIMLSRNKRRYYA